MAMIMPRGGLMTASNCLMPKANGSPFQHQMAWAVSVRILIAYAAESWCLGRMSSSERAHYLQLTLWEQKAARNSPSSEARMRHEELAIAYEMRCLMDPPSSLKEREIRLGQGRSP